MNEITRIRFLRASYWVGAVVDALVIVPMLSPKVASLAFGIPDFEPGNDYRYAMSIAAALMLGWVGLLLWADRKPVERKGVLLLTLFPVVAGLIVSGVFAVTSDFVAADKMLPTWVMQAMLVLLFGFSYLKASRLVA